MERLGSRVKLPVLIAGAIKVPVSSKDREARKLVGSAYVTLTKIITLPRHLLSFRGAKAPSESRLLRSSLAMTEEEQSKLSSALPITWPGLVARMATPGVEELVRKSPTSIAPFSKLTLTGTLPDKAPGLPFLCPGERVMEGSDEITPRIVD